MDYGFEKDLFYVEYSACSRPHGTMRQEHESYAKQLAESSTDLWLGFSGGIDSQSILHSFYNLGYPLQVAFLYMPGYNDIEYNNVKIIERKYGIDIHIIDLDPMALKKEIKKEGIDLDMPTLINILQRKFLSCLPNDCDFISNYLDPFVYINPESGFSYFYQGYYLPEISKKRMFESLNRKGRNIFWGENIEFLASIIDDDIFKSAVSAAKYFDENGIVKKGKNLKTVDRYDYYIKPLLYGKYWKDELIYFPKFTGTENIKYISGNSKFKKHAVTMPYYDFLEFLNRNTGEKKRFYENVTDE